MSKIIFVILCKLGKTLGIGERISQRKKLEDDISSSDKNLSVDSPSEKKSWRENIFEWCKILVWIHQATIVIFNMN